jgi:hypothetical protein
MNRKAYRELPPALQAKVASAFLDASRTPQQLAQEFGVDLAQVEAWKNDLGTFLKGGRAFASAATANPAAGTARPGAGPGLRPPPMRPLPKLPTGPSIELAVDEEATRLSDFPTLWEASPVKPAATLAEGLTRPADSVPAVGAGTQSAPNRAAGLAAQTPSPVPAAAPQAAYAARPAVADSGAAASRPASPIQGPAPSGFLARFFIGRRERREAAKTAQEMLDIYRKISGAYPALKGSTLYRQVVVAYKGGGLPEADSVLRKAADSYAKWPNERPLVFRDVVHYVAVTDYLATNVSANWTQENIGRQVAKLVRESL